MPNWVSNRLTIEGPVADVEALVLMAAGREKVGEATAFTFNAFVKQPDDLFLGNVGPQEEKLYPGNKNWYGWNNNNWGTKWDCRDVDIQKVPTEPDAVNAVVIYTFTTAWSSPGPVVRALADRFPSLTVKHEWSDEDCSGSNHGRTNYENGREVGTEEFDGGEPTEELVEMAITLHGYNPYSPKCECCEEELTDTEIASQKIDGRYGICDECKQNSEKEDK